MGRITFLGNFGVDYSSETHHANTLVALGWEVIRLQETEVSGEDVLECALTSDAFVWIHTHMWQTPGLDMGEVLKELKKHNIPSLTYHLDLWFGLDREKDLETDPFYKQIEYFFATDKLMCDWFNKETNVKGIYLPAGVYEPEAEMVDGIKVHDVIFVGSKGYHKEWQYRPKLINWLAETYGDRFGHYSGEQEAIALKRGKDLNQLYADSKVVVGDSLCLNFNYPYYWSDRVPETLGRGGFLIMPYIKGLDNYFEDGKHLVNYEFNDFDQLKFLIDYYIENDKEREAIRKAGHEEVKKNHTYTNRWQTILKEIGL